MKKIFSLALAALMLFTLISCTTKEAMTDEAYDYDYSYSQNVKFENTGSSYDGGSLGYVSEDRAEAEMPMEEPKAPAEMAPEAEAPDVTAGRKIIYTASFNLETKDYDKSISELERVCNEYGAWFESARTYGTAEMGNRSAYYTVRIPVENYRSFISRQGDIGVVISSSENNTDITERYTDIEARLASATLREERVLKILENASRLDDVLTLERELSDIRYEIESYTGSLRKYDSQVSYSTVTVSIAEVTVITPTPPKTLTFAERLARGFKSGIEEFVDGVEDFVIFLSYNLIGLVFWAIVIVAVIVIITRKVNKRRKKKALPTEEAPKEEEK